MSERKTFLKAQEVADRLECHRRTVINLAKANGIGANMGGSVGYRFTEDDVDALLAALGHRVAS
jgi:excisionase family DNA binding protein